MKYYGFHQLVRYFSSKFSTFSILIILGLSINNFELKAQTPWYFNGTGALNDLASWGTNTNGTGGTLTSFTTGGRYFFIQNTTAVSLTGIWNVGNTLFANAGGDSIIIGNHTTAVAPITLTLAPSSALTVNKSRTIGVAAPSSGNNKIVYQNSTVLSLGAIADVALEIVFDGNIITTSSSSSFGDISLINNATVDMGAASLILKNLTVSEGSILSGPIGGSANYIGVKAGGLVTINGTFRAGRTGGLFTANNAPFPTTGTSFGSFLFQDAVTQGTNLILGLVSTIDFNRGGTGQTGAQTINALSYANIRLSNASVASNKTFASGNFNISGTMTVDLLGTIATPTTQNINFAPRAKLSILSVTSFPTPSGTGRLNLLSDATGSASISALATGASIAGRIQVSQFIPGGFRRFRFLAHPFSVAQAIGELTDDIDVTGNTAGTSLSTGQTVGFGFARTSTNNPSTFYFNTTTANGAITNDAGWVAFNEDTTRNWLPGQGIRVLVRGTKGQTNTINGSDSLPSNVTLDFTGNPNFGLDTIKLVTGGLGSTAGFNLVGNPYPSAVNIGAVLNANTNIGSSIYLRNPQTGSYTTINPIPGSYIIPAYSAFFVKANAPTDLYFSESNKSDCITCATVFRMQSPQNHFQIKAIKDELEYDNVNFNFNSNYSAIYDEKMDAVKLNNDGLNIYVLSNDGQKLAADYRSISNGTIIPLGISLPKSNGLETYTLKVSDFNFSNGYKLTLHDKLLNKFELLTSDMKYTLTVDPTNPKSIGDNRLQIIISK